MLNSKYCILFEQKTGIRQYTLIYWTVFVCKRNDLLFYGEISATSLMFNHNSYVIVLGNLSYHILSKLSHLIRKDKTHTIQEIGTQTLVC